MHIDDPGSHLARVEQLVQASSPGSILAAITPAALRKAVLAYRKLCGEEDDSFEVDANQQLAGLDLQCEAIMLWTKYGVSYTDVGTAHVQSHLPSFS